MRSEHLEIYESWQISIPTISHSYLNYLAPIGVYTPLVESLTSYISRLAVSHTMNVGTLLEREVTRLIDKKYGAANPQSISRVPGAVNGIGLMTRDLVCALEQLTMQQDLHLLTMLSFAEIVPSRSLFRAVRAWCPQCYQEWYERGDSLYEPLLWSLKPVKYCPTHQTPLVDKCPNCQQHNPPFGRKFQLGFCSQCDSWLGQVFGKKACTGEEDIEPELWRVEAVGALLALRGKSRDKLSATYIPQQLSALANEATAGNLAALSRRLKIPKNTLWLWHSGEVIPSLESSLSICGHFNIALVQFFTGEIGSLPNLDNWRVPKQQPSAKASSQAFDLKVARLFLEQVLSQEISPPLSVVEVSRKLGCNRRILYKYFPDLCSAIASIYKNYLQQSCDESLACCCHQVQQIVAQLYREGQYPSESRVAQLMDKPNFLRYEQVRSVLKSARSHCESAITQLDT
jgi:transcriptional regulator with XRE-family HTH domain